MPDLSQDETGSSQDETTLPESTSETIGDRNTPAVIAPHQTTSLRSNKANRPAGPVQNHQ